MRKLLSALSLVLWCWASGAGAQTASEDAAAREALARGDYQAVVAAYPSHADRYLNDKALYRLSIALHKLGQSKAAAALLARAEMINPKGTFASTPDRLKSWKQEINAAAAVTAEAKDLAIPSWPGGVTTGSPVAAVAVAPPAELPALSPVAPASAPTAAASEAAAQVQKQVVPKVVASSDRLDPRILIAVALPLTLIILLSWYVLRRRKPSPAALERVRQAQLQGQLEVVRDEMADLIGRLVSGKAENTELFGSLRAVMPVIEREIGRARYMATADDGLLAHDDAEAAKLMERLNKAPLKLSETSGTDVAALFQSVRRTI